MSIGLWETLLKVLAVPEGSLLRQNIIRSACGLLAGGVTKSFELPDGAADVSVVDLFSTVPQRHQLAVAHLAALWIAAKFWGTSLQRVSLVSLVTDIITQIEGTVEADACSVMLQATQDIVNRVYNMEMVLLRQSEYVVPGAYLGKECT